MHCCGGCWRPRYQVLVDALISQENESQLDQAHLDRLLLYVQSSSNELGRVSIHLSAKLECLVEANSTM